MLALMAREDEAVIVAREIRRLLALQANTRSGSFGGEGKDGDSPIGRLQFSAGDYAADDFDLSVLAALEEEVTAADAPSSSRRLLEVHAATPEGQSHWLPSAIVSGDGTLVVSSSRSPRAFARLSNAFAALQAATEAREAAFASAAAHAAAALGLSSPEAAALRQGLLAGEAKRHRLLVWRVRNEEGSRLAGRAESEGALRATLRAEHGRQKVRTGITGHKIKGTKIKVIPARDTRVHTSISKHSTSPPSPFLALLP
jgi:hypothetical protein